MSKRTPKQPMSREAEIASAQRLGKHLPRQKRALLLAVTLLACAMPMVLGVRLWDQIPQMVPSGLKSLSGADDPLPRWAVVFGLSGLMCLLDAIAHGQLWLYQSKLTPPPKQIRFMGRWGFPILSVLFCSGMIRQSAGQPALAVPFTVPCVLGLFLLILGGQVWDCPKDAKLALRFSFTQCSDQAWSAVHRVAGGAWMAAGLLTIFDVMLRSAASPYVGVVVLAALAAPFVYGTARGARLG